MGQEAIERRQMLTIVCNGDEMEMAILLLQAVDARVLKEIRARRLSILIASVRRGNLSSPLDRLLVDRTCVWVAWLSKSVVDSDHLTVDDGQWSTDKEETETSVGRCSSKPVERVRVGGMFGPSRVNQIPMPEGQGGEGERWEVVDHTSSTCHAGSPLLPSTGCLRAGVDTVRRVRGGRP